MLARVAAAGDATAGDLRVSFSAWTASPRPMNVGGLDAVQREALLRCGPGDAGLAEAARTIAAKRASGGGLVDLEGIAMAQRAAGEPHPWGRVWAATGAALSTDAIGRAVEAWVGTEGTALRRCGVASARAAGGETTVVVLAVDALADLSPLPTKVRLGQWVTVEAKLRVGATGGKIFVAGPTGFPRELPTYFDGATLRAPFSAASTGPMTVQVLADLPTGPRPVIEASLFADDEPPAVAVPPDAPGQGATCPPTADLSCPLTAMLEAARASLGLPPLLPDPALASVARTHAAHMAQTCELAHDAGDGGVADRMRAAGIEPDGVAENLVRAPSVFLAHRALWASPSHRENMLLSGVHRVGVGVVRDGRGEIWAVEIESR